VAEIRSAALGDFDQLALFKRDIHSMHVKHARNFYKDAKDPLTLEELQDAIAGKDGKAAYVLLVDGLLAGYAFTKLVEIRSNPIILDQKLLFIEDMYIDCGLRRKGYGREFMKLLQQLASDSDCASIVLDVWDWNKDAIAFYESLGLRRTLVRMKLWIQPKDAASENSTAASQA
jgi:diamine N-acetyltransferase